MNLTSIPALQDNYIWILSETNGRCLIVDPADATPVLTAIKENHWQPEAILLTHHHHDHVGGVPQLREKFPHIKVYGPAETRDKGATHIVRDGDQLTLLERTFSVLATPGHTSGHVVFYSAPWLFCGDTLFSGGCGRLFEGSAEQMYHSLEKIDALPEDTLICCAHEYTLDNMKFALSILPDDACLISYYHHVNQLRAKKQSTLPVTLKNERRINIFLRIIDKLTKKPKNETDLQHSIQQFTCLRSKKDNF